MYDPLSIMTSKPARGPCPIHDPLPLHWRFFIILSLFIVCMLPHKVEGSGSCSFVQRSGISFYHQISG